MKKLCVLSLAGIFTVALSTAAFALGNESTIGQTFDENEATVAQYGLLNTSTISQLGADIADVQQAGAFNGSSITQNGANTATVDQDNTGASTFNGNSATIVQGTLNAADVTQLGDSNIAEVTQGMAAFSSINQAGDGNFASTEQTGLFDMSDIDQMGNDNYAELDQMGLNNSIIRQYGIGNFVDATQYFDNDSFIYQAGLDNYAYLYQYGDNDLGWVSTYGSAIEQLGSRNSAQVAQYIANASYDIYQQGDDNTAVVDQFGDVMWDGYFNVSDVNQVGNLNEAYLSQSFGDHSYISQAGNSNFASVVQDEL